MIVTSVPKRGYDAWVILAKPNAKHGSTDWMQLQNAAKRGYLWLPMPKLMKGRTIASAILTGHVHGSVASQSITFTPAAAKWQASEITWNNQPATTGTAVTVALGAMTDGQEFSLDITSLAQQISDGLSNFGWRITSNASTAWKIATFDSGVDSWTLTVEFDEDPEAPTVLAPDGTVVGAGKPVVTFDFTEYGSTDSDLAKVRVEVDTNGDGTVDWDSGWVTATDPSLDLTAAGMTGTITSGQTIHWRASVQDQTGRQSVASDWATYTYKPRGTATWSNPAGSDIYDPTTELIVGFSGASLAAYRFWVTDGDDRTQVRYDSGKQKATSTTQAVVDLPLKYHDSAFDGGTRVFIDDSSYQLHARLFDTENREATPGVPAWVDLWKTVTFDDDGALSPVTTFAATQFGGTPFVQLAWTDSAAPDAYIISRDDGHIARLDPADVIVSAGHYTWLDQGAAPAVEHEYKVRRLTEGTGRSPAVSDTITVNPEGIWLLRDNGDHVVLDDVGIDQLQTLERRLRYTPINTKHAVDIITQFEGISGPVATSIEDAPDQTVSDAKSVLDAIKRHPNEVVQFIFASVSKPVLVSNLSTMPDPDYRGDMNRHKVTFNVDQVGDFDYSLPGSGGGSAGID